MYRVIIVDDEPYIVSLIERLVDWDAMGMTVVGRANDGIQGLEMTRTLKPDILIADVMMPGCDGISLIKEVRQIDRNIMFIMISGHKRFEFAKSAMKYNVVDYLMKPIDKGELEGILLKIKSEIDSRVVKNEEDTKMRNQLGMNKAVMNALAVEHLCSGELFDRALTLQSASDMYFTDFTRNDQAYCCAIIQLSGITEDVISSFLEDFLKSLSRQILGTFSEACHVVYSYVDYYRIVFLLGYEIGCEQAVEHCASAALKVAKSAVSKYPGLHVALGVGKSVVLDNGLRPLAQALDTAQNAVNAYLVLGSENAILYRKHSFEEVNLEAVLPQDHIKKLRIAIRADSATQIKTCISQIYESAGRLSDRTPTIYYNIATTINKELYQYLRMVSQSEVSYEKLNKDIGRALAGVSAKKDIPDVLTKYICDYIDDVLGEKNSNLSHVIRTAKRFIDNNYSSNIGLKDVAKIVNVSSAYFSVLFKKEMNENFIDYLNRVRIEASKILLKDSDKGISEVCDKCGFSDARYFSKTFKRYIGITPSDYRNRHMM